MKALRVQSKLQRAKPVEGRTDPSLKPIAPALELSLNIDPRLLWQGDLMAGIMDLESKVKTVAYRPLIIYLIFP